MALACVSSSDTELVTTSRALKLSHAQDETLLFMKAEHLKAQADEAVRQGNFGVAVSKYTACMEVKPGGNNDARLLNNRALALTKAGKHAAAALDAARACELEPRWTKAWFRLGTAQLGAGRALAAVDAFSIGLRLDQSCKNTRGSLRRAVLRLTREEVAAKLLQMIEAAQARGWLTKPTAEEVDPDVKQEAMFRHIQLFHRDKPTPGDYYEYIVLWLEEGLTPGLAYIQRSLMYHRAKCYAQAAEDAAEAVKVYQSSAQALVRRQPNGRSPDALMVTHVHRPGTTLPFRRARLDLLAWAWHARGEAHKADKDHPTRDLVAAAGCFVRALDLDSENPIYGQSLASVASELNQAQMCGVLDSVYLTRSGREGQAASMLGMSSAPQGPTHRCVSALRFPHAVDSSFRAEVRQVFKSVISNSAGVPPSQVIIERVRLPSALERSGESPALEIHFQVLFGEAEASSAAYAQRCMSEALQLLGGIDSPLCCALGVPDSAAVTACSETIILRDDAALENAGERLLVRSSAQAECSQIVPATPVTQLELPYNSYRLVLSDGRAVERADKHPFQLSRVFYDAKERPEEVWAELKDGSCRWRQSASEVAIIALRVPNNASKQRLDVVVDLHHIRVACKDTGTVYLDGVLERGIIPDESVWALGGGDGEDGFVFYLKKMNLELLAGEGGHEETWWPRLFTHHTPIAWDDYAKDYSDLPEDVLQQHALQEDKSRATSAVEQAEKCQREAAQERDDARRRTRQERLHVLRGGQPMSWVELDRLNPAVDMMPTAPVSAEGALVQAVRANASAKNVELLNSVINN